MNRGIHTKPNEGQSTIWLTPPKITKALGPFDLDPCAAVVESQGVKVFWDTQSRWHYADYGLEKDWEGFVWLNPPYGTGQNDWLKKMTEHNNGIALLASRTEVERWFVPYVWDAASSILFLHKRLYFHDAEGNVAEGNAGHGSVLVAYGDEADRRLKESGLKGSYVSEWCNQTTVL